MKKILYGLSVAISALISVVSFSGFVYAAPQAEVGTSISGTYSEDLIWTKEASPYLLTGELRVTNGYTLTIKSGVTIQLKPGYYGAIFIENGGLSIQGTQAEPVKVQGINKIHATNSGVDVTYTDMETTGPGLVLYWSKAKIASSTFSQSTGAGLYIWGSEVDIQASQIKNNQVAGITVVPDAIGKPSSNIRINNSSIINNGSYSIKNSSNTSVAADRNWWGTSTGPFKEGSNKIVGLVMYDPWLEVEPVPVNQAPTCCSSVLFIPGLQASRLYRNDNELIGDDANRLWEPNRNDDVRRLFLDSNGSSTDNSIYSDDPIDKALGFVEIYDSFLKSLDSLKASGKIADWKSYAYDWRMPISEVAESETKRASYNDSLITRVQELAEKSKTGKVTLIAHSNGGLVTKYLVKKLTELGKENLIDSVISVAVPYLGTPQAILGLLHGDDQSMAHGIILKKSVAQELGMNMSSTYTLLPSLEYFKHVIGPTIAFANSSTTDIATYESQKNFLAPRTNNKLLLAAGVIRDLIDPFTWPITITRWAIAGWGNLTAKSLNYTKNGYTASTTSLGDGTVVVPSTTYNSGTVVSIDLKRESDITKRDFKHGSILAAPSTQNVLSNILIATSGETVSDIQSKFVGSSISFGEPDYSREKTFTVVSTHSPVDLHVYDSAGNHTGIIAPPSGSDIEEGLYTLFETKIPGSEFSIHGDEDYPETYISLPDESNQTYSVIISGTGVGEFTYMVERIKGGETLSSVEYVNLPVTPLTNASTTVSTGVVSANLVRIDVDGNGSVDIQAQPYNSLDPIQFFAALRKTIITIQGDAKHSSDLINRIKKIEAAYEKDKTKKVISTLEKFDKKLGHYKLSTLTSAQKEALLLQIEVFIREYESQ
ncbi:MAG: hypothetical protein M3Q80_01445 [bacterium]|nr:hypothetical protein [bacterium]